MNKIVPYKQALNHTLQNAIVTYDWLEMIYNEYQKAIQEHMDASIISDKICILCDIFSVYLTTLISGGSSDSKVGSKKYSINQLSSSNNVELNEYISSLNKLEIVEKCKMNRHNRVGHQSSSTGHLIFHKDILDSGIRLILNDIQSLLMSVEI